MARKPSLTGDLAALAEEERSRLGKPPDAEILIAFHEGELPEHEMERVRDWLAVDPEWASIYLDLKRGGLDGGGVAPAGLDAPGAEDAEVDAAWRALAPKLKREASSAEVVLFPGRRLGRALLAVAAALVVAVVLGWFLVGKGGPGLPEGSYFEVAVTGQPLRGSGLSIPQTAAGVEFHIEAKNLSGKVVIELFDSSEELLRRETPVVEQGTEKVLFRVASSSLRDGGSYTLSVRQAPPDNRALMAEKFRLFFEE